MEVSDGDLQQLFTFFASMKSDIDEYQDAPEVSMALDRCTAMMSRDYLVTAVQNTFCPTYPSQLLLLADFSRTHDDALLAHEQFGQKLKELMEASRMCRCRQRIPVPVLLCRGKTIARSAGLSEALEIAYQTGSIAHFNDPEFRRKMIELDSQWLKTLLVSDICDLMTEVKVEILNLKIVNSEKNFKLYHTEGFGLSALPYPGVQYFKKIRQIAQEGIYPMPPWHKWKLEPHLGRPMRLPNPYKWQEYKTWNLRELTQNVVRYLMSVLREPTSTGVLLHCISGWDRTPHAVSLLRMLLWAEGEAHSSLNVDQILYLTVAYDWFLFGHELSRRLKKSYEIMYYTFDILGHLLSAEFSLALADFSNERPPLISPPSSPGPSMNNSTIHNNTSPSTQSTSEHPSQTTSAPSSVLSSPIPNTIQTIPTISSDTNSNGQQMTITIQVDHEGNDSIPTSPISTPDSLAPSPSPSPTIITPTVQTELTPNPPISVPSSPRPPQQWTMEQLIAGPMSQFDLPTKIQARKLRLFELRARFFYFYDAYMLPTYQ